jgi:hypothetical protein
MNYEFDLDSHRKSTLERLQGTLDQACTGRPSAKQRWHGVEATGEVCRNGFRKLQGSVKDLDQQLCYFAEVGEEWLLASIEHGVQELKEYSIRVKRLLSGDAVDSLRSKVLHKEVEGQREVEELISDRIRFDAAVEGLDWILVQPALRKRAGKKRSGGREHRSSVIEHAYLQFSDCLAILDDVDDLIERHIDVVSSVARGNLLNYTRSLIPSKSVLPFFLDGTLELVEFAKKDRRVWAIAQPLLKEGMGEDFREAIFSNVEAAGTREKNRLKSLETPGGELKRVYEWRLSGPERVPYRLQLVTPSPSRRKRVMEMRVRPLNSMKDEAESGRQPQGILSPSWLAGRLMILEGVVFRWVASRAGSSCEAKATAVLDPSIDLSDDPMILVDCQTNEILQPLLP